MSKPKTGSKPRKTRLPKKEKLHPVNFVIKIPIYNYDIMFSAEEMDSSLWENLERRGVPKPEIPSFIVFPGHGRCLISSGGQMLIRLRYLPVNGYWKGVLAHEIQHSVEMKFEDYGMTLCKQSSEAYAYLIGYITQMIYEKLERCQRRKRN